MSRTRRGSVLTVLLGAAALAVTGCIQGGAATVTTLSAEDAVSDPVIPSEIYAVQVGEVAQASRVAELADQVNALRSETTGGWQARQSDVTGYASEVSGGTFTGPADPVALTTEFLDRFGGLFGPATDLVYESTGFDDLGLATVRVTQARDGVTVEDSRLTATLRTVNGTATLDGVRGQVIDLTGVTTTPALSEAQAVRAAEELTGAVIDPTARLAIVNTGTGTALAWFVLAPSGPPSVGITYPAVLVIDAMDGSLLGARTTEAELTGTVSPPTTDGTGSPTVTELGNYTFTFPQGGRPIVIDTDYLGRFPIQVNAQQLPDGSILMLDATGPGANLTTKNGLIAVIDARQGGFDRDSLQLGPVAQYPSVQAIPKDALYALWGARQTLDVLSDDFGLASFDGDNSPLPIVINDTQGEPCLDNAFFLTSPGASFASFGIPCQSGSGRSRETMVAIEIMGHEVGHGVTYSATTFLGANRQQRGLGEGLADYIGMIVRNSLDGGDATLLVGDQCQGLSASDSLCESWPDGEGMRTVDSNATLQDYIFTLDDPFAFSRTGVEPLRFHNNGMIFTNALTDARRAVAAAAGEEPGRSARARLLDRAVVRAITVYFTSSTGFVDAAEAVRRAAADVGMNQTELNILTDRFRANGLCRDCEQSIAPSDYVVPVSVSTSLKTSPVALDDRVAYLLAQGTSLPIAVASTPGVPGGQRIGPDIPVSVTLAGNGTRVLHTQELDSGEAVLGEADIATGASKVVARDVDRRVTPAVGPDAIAWVTDQGALVYRPDGGAPVTKQLDGLTARIATGGGRVAILAADGTLSVWTPATDATRVIAQLNPGFAGSFRANIRSFPLGALAMSGNRIATVSTADDVGSALVFDLDANTRTTHSSSALPLGIAISDDFVVWTESVGFQQTPLAPGRQGYPDTELRGRNFTNGALYRMVNHRGVQGFPALSDRLLVWQESANGGSDVYAARLGTG